MKTISPEELKNILLFDPKAKIKADNSSASDSIRYLSSVEDFIRSYDELDHGDGKVVFKGYLKNNDPFRIVVTESKGSSNNMKTIRIQEDVRIPGTDVILEKGDKIEVLKEDRLHMGIAEDISDKLVTLSGMAIDSGSVGMTAAAAIDFAFQKFKTNIDPEYAHDFLVSMKRYLKDI